MQTVTQNLIVSRMRKLLIEILSAFPPYHLTLKIYHLGCGIFIRFFSNVYSLENALDVLYTSGVHEFSKGPSCHLQSRFVCNPKQRMYYIYIGSSSRVYA